MFLGSINDPLRKIGVSRDVNTLLTFPMSPTSNSVSQG